MEPVFKMRTGRKMSKISLTMLKNWNLDPFGVVFNKKDGHRQQNLRQRQTLIIIIDYDVCMTFY